MNKKKDYLGGYTEYPWFFKGFIVIGIVLIAFIFIYYTQVVISELKENSTRVVNAYAKLWQLVALESTTGQEIGLIFEEVIQKSRFPIVVTDAQGEPQAWREVEIPWDDTSYLSEKKLKEIIKKMDKGKEPIPIYYGESNENTLYLHYADPRIISRLRWMPLVQIGVVFLLGLAAFITFRNIKRSEQRSIWVGMAKETAHQLGTPLSSLLGWLELLKEECETKYKDNLENMEKDIKRLEKIANRFGQIGSLPELEPVDLNHVVSEVVSFFKVKLPHDGLGVKIKEELSPLTEVEINSDLIAWVVENLIKNSLEAVDPREGMIKIWTQMGDDQKTVLLGVMDNGKGIPSGEQKKIFGPGYTTKKRGWGLGLSLARRIVEDYHSGKIYLKESVSDIKTTFVVLLPLKTKA
ncbi:MAG: HAMP domain-containing sensor histidine kinase [Candidatus Zixiibacteriota bacterium]